MQQRRNWSRQRGAHPKPQIPSSKPQGKFQYSISKRARQCFRVWRFEASLGFGVWDLGFPPRGGTTPARFVVVETAKHSLRKVTAERDIFFHCQHCKAALIANRSAAGMMLTCQKCSQLTAVPQSEEPTANTLAYADEVRGKLTENESQRAEVTGNINQLTIQLHRWQLRLQTLNDRKAQLEKELGGK